MAKLKISPPGMALHVHIAQPDGRYKPDNPEYKTKLVLDADKASGFKELVDAAVDAAFLEHLEKLPKAQYRLWSKGYPYEDELDRETGEPTGRVIFKFKQNANIKLKSGEVKRTKILIQDAAGKRVETVPYTGDTIRVAYSFRPAVVASSKVVTVRMDFGGVQIIDKRERGFSFGAVEGGWTQEDVDDGADDFATEGADVGGAKRDAGTEDGADF